MHIHDKNVLLELFFFFLQFNSITVLESNPTLLKNVDITKSNYKSVILNVLNLHFMNIFQAMPSFKNLLGRNFE